VGHHHSVDGTDGQKKLREKMIIKANSQVAPFNDKAEDFITWRDDAIMSFKQAGRMEVLLPDFHEWAKAEGWTKVEILDADEWAYVILKDALAGCDDALDVFEMAPQGEGAKGFAHLRRHYELLSSNVKENLRLQLTNFKLKSGENPLKMFARLNKLYVRYGKTINPEPQTTESKIRKVLKLCSKFQSLDVKIKIIRSALTSGEKATKRGTCQWVCEQITAEWMSFGEDRDVQIHRMGAKDEGSNHDDKGNDQVEGGAVDMESFTAKDLQDMRKEMAELKVKVAHGAATKDLGQGKWSDSTPQGDGSGNFGLCLVPGCKNDIESPRKVIKRPTTCRTCWTDFHEGEKETMTLKDKRVVTKTRNPQWPKSVKIKSCSRLLFLGDASSPANIFRITAVISCRQ